MAISKRCKTTNERNVVLDHLGILAETDKATLFEFDEEPVWIAKSLIEYDDETTVEVPRWLAEEKSLL